MFAAGPSAAAASGSHQRQGSASSVDRTLRPGGQKHHYHNNSNNNALRQAAPRARTPNPDDLLHSDVNAALPERRAMTPGPEWGRYDSDNDDNTDAAGTTGEHKHFRQSSYLTAMEELSKGLAAAASSSTTTATTTTTADMNSQHTSQAFDANIGSYNVNKAAYANAMQQSSHSYDTVDYNSQHYSQARSQYGGHAGQGAQASSSSGRYYNNHQHGYNSQYNGDYGQQPAYTATSSANAYTSQQQVPYAQGHVMTHAHSREALNDRVGPQSGSYPQNGAAHQKTAYPGNYGHEQHFNQNSYGYQANVQQQPVNTSQTYKPQTMTSQSYNSAAVSMQSYNAPPQTASQSYNSQTLNNNR